MLKLPENKLLRIYTDGASRGNPGPSALAFIFVIDEKVIHKKSEFIGKQTNNQVEYQAIIEALSKAKTFTNGAVEVFSDSELVINQINGDYQVKNAALSKLFKQVIDHKNSFQKIKFIHVPRDQHWISKVDKLCNSCLNEYPRK